MVVVTVGAAEKGPDGGVVTTDEALRVVKAADLAGLAHVVVVYDLGAGGPSGESTYNVLDGLTSFFSNLFSRVQSLLLDEFLATVVETDVRYTLIKTSTVLRAPMAWSWPKRVRPARLPQQKSARCPSCRLLVLWQMSSPT